jgi:hypothetical protein
MSEILSLIAVIASYLLFGGIGMAIGERCDRSGATNNSDAAFSVILGTAGAVVVGLLLRQLGFW